MRETTEKLGNIEEIFLSCPLGSERLATALPVTIGFIYLYIFMEAVKYYAENNTVKDFVISRN